MNEFHNARAEKFEKRASRWAWGGVLSLLACIISFALSKDNLNQAEKELKNDPQYVAMKKKEEEQKRLMREKELEVERQRYLYEQEKLIVARENKRQDEIRAKQAEALETINEYAANVEDYNDYELVDNAYQILDILRSDSLGDQVKYRALSCLAKFDDEATMNSDESKKLHQIIEEIEGM